MLIVCPRCAARYEVADALIGPAGKSVRCAKCSHVWLARREAASEDETPLSWPEPPRARASVEAIPPPPPPREDPGLAAFSAAQARPGPVAVAEAAPGSLAAVAVIGWLATVAALGVGGWAAYAFRDAVIEAWPPSERVYLALGLRS
jgi:predicted Zn finger-like uncharacterized protein